MGAVVGSMERSMLDLVYVCRLDYLARKGSPRNADGRKEAQSSTSSSDKQEKMKFGRGALGLSDKSVNPKDAR
jgi:hypothetical protein